MSQLTGARAIQKTNGNGNSNGAAAAAAAAATAAAATAALLVELAANATDTSDRRWQERANCLGVDPDLFFPERGASTREAKSVCRGCDVRLECLEYALGHGEKFGIWGGLSERERRRVRRERAIARRK
ncbi:MAG: WhiB family transcriptional regulator, partial [Acidimicrobiia bacterium]